MATRPYPIPSDYVNRKYIEEEVDLAAEGWRFVQVCIFGEEHLDEIIKRVTRDGRFECLVKDCSPVKITSMQETEPAKGIYVKGEGIKPRVGKELISDATVINTMSEDLRLIFLLDAYAQIFTRRDQFYDRFKKRDGEIAQTLNYFADKLRRLGREKEADRLERAVWNQFPAIETPWGEVMYTTAKSPERKGRAVKKKTPVPETSSDSHE